MQAENFYTIDNCNSITLGSRMNAEDFYTNDIQNSISLKFISTSDLDKVEFKLKKNFFNNINFNAKAGEVAPVFDENGEINEYLVGIGDAIDESILARSIKYLPPGTYKILQNTENPIFDKIILNWSLEQYKFLKYKKIEVIPKVLYLDNSHYKKIINKVRAVFLIRDLINTPTCDLGPEDLSKELQNISLKHSANFSEIIDQDLLTHNYPAIYTVGKGSSTKPRLLFLSWGNKSNPRVTLIGKGVCFDSGGLNIKSTANMELMKKDMGGAAHVIALADWIMSEKLPIYLNVLVPAVENSVDGNSYRPGDVITMRNGLTVEILNTDAEGRLVLADALCKACEDKPDLILDFATLTGAARVAVGTEIGAMFSNDDGLAHDLYNASQLALDPLWRLPLASQYNSLFESNIADMANTEHGSYAGAIVAALFLQKYIDKNIPWAHFDIMAWNVNSKPGKPVGGEALGFLAVARYLEARFKK